MTLGQAARLGHLLLYIGTYILATVMGQSFQDSIVGTSSFTIAYYIEIPNSLNIDSLTVGCNPLYITQCVANQLVYRAAAILCFFFCGMAVVASYSDSLNRGMWGLKFLVIFGVFIGFWWGSNDFFNGFAEVARIFSFFWLLIQGLLVLDIAHDMHDILMQKAEKEEVESGGSSSLYKMLYLFVTVGFLACGIAGLTALFADPGYTGCKTGMWVVVIGVLVSISQLILSALNSVNRGVLTPSVMFAYATFAVWYALLSCPELECNPSSVLADSGPKKAALGIVAGMSTIILLFCVANGARILQIFSVSGEGVLETGYGGYGTGTNPVNENGSLDGALTGEGKGKRAAAAEIGHTMDRDPNDAAAADAASPNSTGGWKERMFFHVLMALASCYGGMVLTSWGRTDGSPESVGDYSAAGAESMWLKLVSLWVFFLMYYKALHLAHQHEGNK